MTVAFPRARAVRSALSAGAVLLAATSCSGSSDAALTSAQAKQKTDQYFSETFLAFPKPISPVVDRDGEEKCFKKGAPSEPDGRVKAVTYRFLRDIPADHHDTIFDAFRGHLVVAGFRVTDSRPGVIVLTNPDNGFKASVSDGDNWPATLKVGFESPCVSPDGAKAATG
ncbi:hypothetical protein ACIQOV_01370 [Kitasatospora sp. NPDC091257]|uniref:hypothetical protein n=1 Tax=Kitasatospora sp. NPDC091257 TaxID=3364084 RepID=UPI00380B0BB5